MFGRIYRRCHNRVKMANIFNNNNTNLGYILNLGQRFVSLKYTNRYTMLPVSLKVHHVTKVDIGPGIQAIIPMFQLVYIHMTQDFCSTSERCSIELRSADCGGHWSTVSSGSFSRNRFEIM